MALRSLFQNPPFKSPVVASNGLISLTWQNFVNALARLGNVRILEAPLDPPSMVSGGMATITATVSGASPGDFVAVSFNPVVPGVVFHGQVTADNTVSIMVQNLSGSTVDLPSGTLRVRVEMQA